MRKEIYAVLIVAALLILYFSFLSETRKGIFTERLGDMALTGYETGEIAVQEISNIYGLRDMPIEKGYSAVYSGSKGTMRILVVEAPDHDIANDAFGAMNYKLGASEEHEYTGDVGQTGSHSGHEYIDSDSTRPVKVDILEFVKPDVYMMKADNAYNYYYFKMDYRMGRVYWMIFDSPDGDTGYQISIVKQAIMNI